jgi:hypothetical protein
MRPSSMVWCSAYGGGSASYLEYGVSSTVPPTNSAGKLTGKHRRSRRRADCRKQDAIRGRWCALDQDKATD